MTIGPEDSFFSTACFNRAVYLLGLSLFWLAATCWSVGYDAIWIPCYQFFCVKINLNKNVCFKSQFGFILFFEWIALKLVGFNFLAYDKVTGKLWGSNLHWWLLKTMFWLTKTKSFYGQGQKYDKILNQKSIIIKLYIRSSIYPCIHKHLLNTYTGPGFVNILSVLRKLICVIDVIQDSPGGTRSKEPTWQCRRLTDIDSIPGSGISHGRGHDNPVQYCLENPMGIGAWWATVHGVAKSQTRLKQLSMYILCL